jgi:hypothetical protein
MEAVVRSLKISMSFYRTTRRHMPEDSILHGRLRGNLKSPK